MNEEMFCVECGKEPDRLYEGLCRDCFIDKKMEVEIESPIEIEVCGHCGSVKRENKWIEKPDLEAIMLQRIDDAISTNHLVDRYSFNADFSQEDPLNINVDVGIKLTSEDITTSLEETTKIILKKSQCEICSKIQGDYYEAILQIRPSGQDMTEEQKEEIRDIIKKRVEVKRGEERNIFVTFEEEIHGGLDFYLSDTGVSKNLAHEISRKFGGRVTTSSKLTGREDGQNIYRMTYSVRLPPYKRGDFVEEEGQVMRIRKLGGKNGSTIMKDVRTGKIISRDKNDLEDVKVLGGGELIKEAVVVSESDEEIKVLDPESYETVTLVKPEGFEGDVEEVTVLKTQDHLYILQEED